MPEEKTLERAHRDEEEGKAPSTQAGEFVREEMDHIREGKHGARSTKQAIAIGLSKARRAGVKLAPPRKGTQSKAVRKRASRDLDKGSRRTKAPSRKRSRATEGALKREGRGAASKTSLARHARASARKRGPAARKAAGRKAAATRKATAKRKRSGAR
jgi:hypothetical protein